MLQLFGFFIIIDVFCPRLVAEDLFHQPVDLLVKRPKRDARRTHFLAKSAIDAAPAHVNRPHQVERCIRREFFAGDKLKVLQAAFRAKTYGADIPAAIAVYAAVQMLEPPVEPLIRGHAFQVLNADGFLSELSSRRLVPKALWKHT